MVLATLETLTAEEIAMLWLGGVGFAVYLGLLLFGDGDDDQ